MPAFDAWHDGAGDSSLPPHPHDPAYAPADAPAGGLHFTDGAYLDDSYFTNAFPYLKTPIAGSPQTAATQGNRSAP